MPLWVWSREHSHALYANFGCVGVQFVPARTDEQFHDRLVSLDAHDIICYCVLYYFHFLIHILYKDLALQTKNSRHVQTVRHIELMSVCLHIPTLYYKYSVIIIIFW